MAEFTVRVELHYATETNYEALHAAMERAGFRRFVQVGERLYHLPTAEYTAESDGTPEDMWHRVKAVANATGKQSWILVTKSAGRFVDTALIR